MPKSMVRLSAGRESMSDELQALCRRRRELDLHGEKLLTTGNPDTERDMALFARSGLRPMPALESAADDGTTRVRPRSTPASSKLPEMKRAYRASCHCGKQRPSTARTTACRNPRNSLPTLWSRSSAWPAPTSANEPPTRARQRAAQDQGARVPHRDPPRRARALEADGRWLTGFWRQRLPRPVAALRVVNALQDTAAREGAGGILAPGSGPPRRTPRSNARYRGLAGVADALLFGSGFMANLAVGAGSLYDDDLCVQDRLNHASLVDAARLAGCSIAPLPACRCRRALWHCAARPAARRCSLPTACSDGRRCRAEATGVGRATGAMLLSTMRTASACCLKAAAAAAAGLGADAVPLQLVTLARALDGITARWSPTRTSSATSAKPRGLSTPPPCRRRRLTASLAAVKLEVARPTAARTPGREHRAVPLKARCGAGLRRCRRTRRSSRCRAWRGRARAGVRAGAKRRALGQWRSAADRAEGWRSCASRLLRAAFRTRTSTACSTRSNARSGRRRLPRLARGRRMNLHVEVAGDGPPLALLHGWGCIGGVFRWSNARPRFTLHLVNSTCTHSRDSGVRCGSIACVEAIAAVLRAPWCGWSLGSPGRAAGGIAP